MFKNFEGLFYQIKNVLLDSEAVRKLLYYNTSDALSRETPTYEEAKKSIYIKPIIFIYDDSPEYGISSFISIGMVEAIIFPGSIQASIKISIACDRQVWELENDKVRSLALLSEVSNLLNEKKFEAAGKLELRVVKEVYFNNDLVGFTALFDIDEEKGDVVNEF